LNKNNLIKIISEKSEIKKKKAEKIFDTVIDIISTDLKKRKNVYINDFGIFEIIRIHPEVLVNTENIKTVIPPRDIVKFGYYKESDFAHGISSKNGEIISVISIEYVLSRDTSEKIVFNIFETIKEVFNIRNNLNIPKFGDFIIEKNKSLNKGKDYSIKFIPSKKLSRKVNYYFNDLKTVETDLPILKEVLNIKENNEENNKEFEFAISEDFKNEYKEICKDKDENIIEGNYTSFDIEIKTKLISDETIKLHKEITDSGL